MTPKTPRKEADGRLELVAPLDLIETRQGRAGIFKVGPFGLRLVLVPDPSKSPRASTCLHGRPLRPAPSQYSQIPPNPSAAERLCALCAYEVPRIQAQP